MDYDVLDYDDLLSRANEKYAELKCENTAIPAYEEIRSDQLKAILHVLVDELNFQFAQIKDSSIDTEGFNYD